MNQPASEPVSVHILDREYTVGVNPDERDSLLSAARLLDSKMREVRGSNRMAAIDRIAVLAALNFAHELEQLRSEADRLQRIGDFARASELRFGSIPTVEKELASASAAHRARCRLNLRCLHVRPQQPWPSNDSGGNHHDHSYNSR